MEKINTLTDYQKEFFDFCIEEHNRIKKTDPTTSQQLNLIDWIVKDYEMDFKMISHRTGKLLSGREKYMIMCIENRGMLENILDW
jgi:hypothetical protein